MHRIKFSSTTREYADGLLFSSLNLNLEFWCQVIFPHKLLLLAYVAVISNCRCSPLKVRIQRLKFQFCEHTKCLCTLKDLELYLSMLNSVEFLNQSHMMWKAGMIPFCPSIEYGSSRKLYILCQPDLVWYLRNNYRVSPRAALLSRRRLKKQHWTKIGWLLHLV